MLAAIPLTPLDVQPVLACLGKSGAVLVGGQCINVWSLILEQPAFEPWKSSRPYTSFDADAVATRAEMSAFVNSLEEQKFRVKVQLPRTDEEANANVGLVFATKGRREVAVNLLTQLIGISGQEARRNQVEIMWEGSRLVLLHPELCVESKTFNLLTLDQNVPGQIRQDRKHLLLALANLRERLRPNVSPTPHLTVARRLTDFALDEPGRAVRRQHGIDILTGIPWADWAASEAPGFREFAAREAEFRNEVERRDEAEREVDRWFAELKRRDRKRPGK